MGERLRWTLAASLVVLVGCSGSGSDGATGELGDIAATTTPTATVPTTPTTLPPPTTEPEDSGRETACVVAVRSGDSLGAIAVRVESVSLDQILDENRLSVDAVIHPGDELDICVDNGVDDILGVSRLAPAPAAVQRQQNELNDLFAQYRLIPLTVDGDSGKLTRQMVCAARLGLGLPVSVAHLAADSEEEEIILAADELGVPAGAATWASKWMVIDKTCQVMFIGEGEELVNVYPTSTGEPGHETLVGQSFTAARYDPALDTNGWHDSSSFPVAIDNPLNGNMYKPIYFNGGQAIHGANYVPPSPRSKGCARTFPLHQDEIIRWLGIDGLAEPTWRASDIGLTVTVQGAYRSID